MSDFQIKPATRQGVNPLIVPYSESGCGKTFSSLLLARGIAGPTGKIVVADSESRRASLYADVLPGGFETFDLCEPFSPARYVQAVDTIEKSGAAVGIIDSGSHEWEGALGVLDMAMENEQRSGKSGLHNWKTPKLEHAKFVQRLLRTKIPLIVCLRAKYKTKQGKDERGKTCIIKDEFVSPIQAEDFIFESTVHFEILQDHSIRLTKVSHPGLRDCFPAKGPITIQTGELIARWCAAPSGSAPAVKQPDGIADLRQIKSKLWEATRIVHGSAVGEKDKGVLATAKEKLVRWLWDESIVSDSEHLDTLTPDRLIKVLADAEFKLSNPPTP